MIDDEVLIESVCGSLAIEGLQVPESTRSIMRECADGKRSFDDAVSMIIAQQIEATDE